MAYIKDQRGLRVFSDIPSITTSTEQYIRQYAQLRRQVSLESEGPGFDILTSCEQLLNHKECTTDGWPP